MSEWTLEMDGILRRMRGEGQSYSDIAKAINLAVPHVGLTRNSICGRAHRLGLTFEAPMRPAARGEAAMARITAAREARAAKDIVRAQAKVFGETKVPKFKAPPVKRDLLSANAVNFRKPAAKHWPLCRSGDPSEVAMPATPILKIAGNGQVFEQAEAREPRVVVAFPDEGPGAATLLTLQADMCRWPIGDTRDPGFTFCGAPKDGGGSYCAAHAKRSAAPVQPGKPRTANELARSLRRYVGGAR